MHPLGATFFLFNRFWYKLVFARSCECPDAVFNLKYKKFKIVDSKWWSIKLAKNLGENTKNGEIAIVGFEIYEICIK